MYVRGTLVCDLLFLANTAAHADGSPASAVHSLGSLLSFDIICTAGMDAGGDRVKEAQKGKLTSNGRRYGSRMKPSGPV